jgi:integrase
LSHAELKRLLDAAKAHSATFHAMVLVSLAIGMRQGELLRFSWADIDSPHARVRLLGEDLTVA